ncbi:MAG: GAF domain-containing protein [Candidatus Omnitrophica bacterium]|nr:GAF domain-containing protein [Candidatus Omnitrophota bacterium]
MNDTNHNQMTERFLELTSEGMLYFSHREQFMDWVTKSLAKQLQASHVSLALLDRDHANYPIRYSSGEHKLPLHLLALEQETPVMKWFLSDMKELQFIRRTNRIVVRKELNSPTHMHPFFRSLERDLDLHHTEVCVKIQTPQGIAGCLLVGIRKNLTPYSNTELTFFQILSNQIALEIEKEQLHTNAQRSKGQSDRGRLGACGH